MRKLDCMYNAYTSDKAEVPKVLELCKDVLTEMKSINTKMDTLSIDFARPKKEQAVHANLADKKQHLSDFAYSPGILYFIIIILCNA